jgi:choice-of-anchor B domain-containing protein
MKINYLFALLLLTAFIGAKAQYPASNFTLVGQLSPEPFPNGNGAKYSGCWGWYQASKNKEYAILGSQSGTYWVDVTSPTTPTVSAYKAGAVSGATWREIKTYQNYCYVISDDFGSNRFQIFDMQYLPDSVSKIYDSQSLIKRAHAAWIDGNKLYLSSVTFSNNNTSTMNVYSLANPASPTLIRRLDQDYNFITGVHDMYARNDTVYVSCAWQGLYVFKLTSGNTFQMLGSLTSYPGSGYNHSSALTPNGQHLVFMDEVPSGLPIKVADVSNLNNIQVLATTNQFAQTTPHNPFMLNAQYCLAASYQEGLQLYDISNPNAPTLAGYFDTYPQGGGNTGNWGATPYDGLWGAYPWLPSKVIVALDMTNGLFLLNTSMYSNTQTISSFNPPGIQCAGNSFTVSNTSINATTYTWTLNGPASGTSTVANPVYTLTAPGIYTLSLLATNGPNTSTSTKTIQVTQVQVNLNGNPVSCANCGVITSTVSNGTAPYTYSWSPMLAFTPNVNGLSVGCYTLTVKDANACVRSASICLVSSVGIEGILPGSGLLIYPNPANQLLTIEQVGSTFNYKLYDRLGRLVILGEQLQNKAQLRLEGVAPGIYFLEVETGQQVLRNKIIIEH